MKSWKRLNDIKNLMIQFLIIKVYEKYFQLFLFDEKYVIIEVL